MTARSAAVATTVSIAALLFLFARTAFTHGDASIPLYVAVDGEDAGACSDPAAPCRSLTYALGQAAKGTQIRVAAGSYPVSDTEELFLLISGVVDIVGGYERESNFAARGNGISTLTGVPAEYRTLLRDRGFHVIADQKAQESGRMAAAEKMLALHGKLQKGAATGPCVGGMAGSLVCENVDLLSHIALADVSAQPSGGNDVWGFTDLNTGREYVVAGFNIGTGVFDISDPEAPREVGFVDGQNASWRDVKVYQHWDNAARRWHAYAYVTTDGSSDGLFVIDLGDLPHAIARVPFTSDFFSAHNVYSSGMDFATGLPLTAEPKLVIAGSNLNVGIFRAYALTAPAAPSYIQGSSVFNEINDGSPYMHDAASLIVTDSRKDTQCVNASASHCELLLDFNEEATEVWDITDASDPQRLNPGRTEYANRGYVHSGWWTEDRQFMFVHDELDEQRFGLNTTLRVFSLANLTAPSQVGTWTGPTNAIDHNGFVRGNRYYMSNYSRGLTILDISDPANPTAVGHLDTYPFADNSGFIGAWGAYPYFADGKVAVSDINSGVYIARDGTRETTAGGQLGFTAPSFGVAEGASAVMTVSRDGGSAGAVTAAVELVFGTADGDDIVLNTSTLSWPDGDAASRAVSVDAVNDGVSENLELLRVRLVNPTGGAVLADAHTASLYVAEPGATSGVQFFADTIETAERGFAKAVVVLHRQGSASGAASVDYAVAGGTATAGADFSGATSGTVSWADGDATPRWVEFDIVDDGVTEGDEDFSVQLSNASGATISGSASAGITIRDGTGINVAPNAIAASGITVAENSTVTLDGSQSSDPDGDTLAFAWAQTSGPTVSLSAPASASTTFTAPSVTSDALLRFRLTVSDPGGLSDSTTVSVTVTNNDGGGGGGGGHAFGLLLIAFAARLAARRRVALTRTGCA